MSNLKGQSFEKIVEYGPGDGVLTKELLKLLTPNGKILLVETDENFVEILNKIEDTRITVVNKKMEDVASSLSEYYFEECDLIVSSIPFSLIEKGDRQAVVKNSFNSLKPGGKFIVFHQYSKLMEKYISKYFKKVKTNFEPRNIFPCFIIVVQK